MGLIPRSFAAMREAQLCDNTLSLAAGWFIYSTERPLRITEINQSDPIDTTTYHFIMEKQQYDKANEKT